MHEVIDISGDKLMDTEFSRTRIYEIYNHDGVLVNNDNQYIEMLESWREETRRAVLEVFPERKVTEVIDPAQQREHFHYLGFETSPVAVIPDDPEAHRVLISLLTQDKVLSGNAFDGIENMFDAYNSLTCHNTDIDLVLYVDPSKRIADAEDNVDAAVTEEYSRMILAHELGHSVERSPERTRVLLDESGAIKSVHVYESGFGAVTDPVDLSDSNYWNGSLWGEGFATLMASTLYRPVAGHIEWTYGDGVGLLLPGWLVSRTEAFDEEFTADNHSLAALTISNYDEKYPGIINMLKSYAKQEISLNTLREAINSHELNLYEKLENAQHRHSYIAAAKESGIELFLPKNMLS